MRQQHEEQQQDQDKTENGQPLEPELKGEGSAHCPDCGHAPDRFFGGGICIGCPCPTWHGPAKDDGPVYCAQCWMNGKKLALVNGDCPNYHCPLYAHGYKERPASVVPA